MAVDADGISAKLHSSGLWIAERDEDKGHPFVQLTFDRPPLILNICGPDESDVAEWSTRIEDARRRHIEGEHVDPLPFIDPAYGDVHYLHAAALEHVIAVSRAFMARVAVEAMRQEHRDGQKTLAELTKDRVRQARLQYAASTGRLDPFKG
jgi:hypothetical protein